MPCGGSAGGGPPVWSGDRVAVLVFSFMAVARFSRRFHRLSRFSETLTFFIFLMDSMERWELVATSGCFPAGLDWTVCDIGSIF